MMCFVFEMLFNLSTFYRCYKNYVDYTICCTGRCTDNSDNYFVLELPNIIKIPSRPSQSYHFITARLLL